MKALILALLAVLTLPAAALARPADLRYDPQVRSSSLGAAPTVLQVPKHLPATGTDVAAPDQQSPIEPAGKAPVTVAPAADDFAWEDAAAGAAATLGVITLSLGGAAVVKRRRVALG
jgi:hypothetical protein